MANCINNKIAAFVAILSCILMCISVPAQAAVGDTFCIEEFQYVVTSEEEHSVSIGKSSEFDKKYDLSVSTLVIPSTVTYDSKEYMVSSIRDFGKSDYFTTVEIPESVNLIDKYAFESCKSLYKIEIPNSVKYIGDYAFAFCPVLKEIKLPNNIQEIPSYAFYKCYCLTTITFPSSLQKIGEYSFRECKSISEVNIPNSVNHIECFAFYGCSSLQKLTLSESLSRIEESVFFNCTSLKEVVIPKSVETIETQAFAGCNSLNFVTLNEGLKCIGASVFSRCALQNIFLPISLEEIYRNPFPACYELKNIEVDSKNPFFASLDGILYDKEFKELRIVPLAKSEFKIPETVTSIGCRACSQNKVVKSVTLPNGLISIGEEAFESCESLRTINLPNSLRAIGMRAFNSCYSLHAIELPDSLKSIGSDAFAYCDMLKEVVVPKFVTNIGTGVFSNCNQLNKVILPNHVDTIPSYTFSVCKSLQNFFIPDSVKVIGEYAFNFSGLKSLRISSKVQTIGMYAFKDTRLDTLYVYSANPPSLGVYAFGRKPYYPIVYVPAGSIGNYYESEGWNQIYDYREMSDSIKITSPEITPIKLNIGEVVQLKATTYPEMYMKPELKWTSENTEIVMVNDNGELTALDAGETIVKVEALDGTGNTDFIKVIVKAPLTQSLTISETELNLKVGDVYELTFDFNPYNAQPNVLWESSNKSVVLVDSVGKISVVGPGTADIIVRTSDGSELSACCRLTAVKMPEVVMIQPSGHVELTVGSSLLFTAEVLPENTTDKTISWISSDDSVVAVSEHGEVTTIGVGDAIVQATCGEVFDNCIVTVTPIFATAISLDHTSIEIEEDEEFKLTTTIEPSDVTYRELNWVSSDEQVAIVDSDGNVKALAQGECEIIVSTTDGSNLTAFCQVNAVAGVSLILDDKKIYDVYDMQGILLRSNVMLKDIENLKSGIYILCQGTKTLKFTITEN